ncbi:fanconi-associated nuclease 1 isoform X1 [Podarcis lilfordi]|uniref:Fanconi-associated nuclease n=1 Tax=Podarcis lilfordi TaxID=74358 RepID=A0AA35LBA0_9SAUR|nr:fanconi-associated nuclease 1 isoform X1 [Podarcis lilfordi]
MAEEELPGNKRPCRSSALNRKRIKPARRKQGTGVEGTLPLSASSFSIASFFNNVPPARVACPLCGQMVARYGINQHIDEVCQKSRDDDRILVGSAPDAGSGPSVENVPGGCSPYFANNASTPEKLVGDNSETKPEVGGQVSPYFKKGGGLLLGNGESEVQAVGKISLGRLSTKLSRKRRAEGGNIFTWDAKSRPAQDVCDSSREENPEGTTSSQKENWLPFSRLQRQTSPKEGFEGKRETLDPTWEGDARTLLGGDGSAPGLFPSDHLACGEVGLLTEDNKEQNTPKEDLDSDICKLVVCSTAYSKEAPSNLETTDLSSGEQALLPNVKGICCNQTQNTSFVGGNMEVLPMEDHTDLKNEVVDCVGLGPLENMNSQSPSSNILETVLNGLCRGEDPGGRPYYLQNFLMVLQAVLENEDDQRLFDENDLDTIAKFYQLSASAQKLYVRLFQRKLSWIKTNKIVYLEIAEDLSSHINELVGTGFLQSEAELKDLSEALDLLSAPELKTLAKVFHLPNPNAQKQQLLEDFLRLSKQRSVFSRNQAGIGNVILKRAKDVAGRSVRVHKVPRTVFSRVLLLFSLTDPVEDEEAGSGGQGQLSTVLMVNMGRMIFPSYTVNRKTQIFQDRDDFIRYASAAYLSNDISVAVTHGNWKEAHRLYEVAKEIWQELREHFSLWYHAALPEYLRRFTVGWVYTRIFSQGVEILQRLRMYKEAVEQLQDLLAQDVYCSDSRGRWWDRLALNLHQHLKDTEEAIRCIRKGLQDPFVRTGHRLSLSQRAQRMKNSSACKKIGHLLQDLLLLSVEDVAHVTIKGKLCPQTGMGKSMFIMEDVGAEDPGEDLEPSTVVCSVEELALAHYKQHGFDQGIHGEGSTFSTLYSLLMWDILFMDGIPDVFRNPYQTCPLDLYTDSFYENRREAVESRLRSLHEASPETLETWIADVWNAQEGKAAALISWDRFSSLQQAQHLARCFGGPFLSGVCRQLSRDLRHCRGGLPDLVVWRTEDHHFKLVEVKGPNDRLSHKQMIWLAELQKLGAAVEVCHVVASGSKSKRLS